jgi:hypothetical protein
VARKKSLSLTTLSTMPTKPHGRRRRSVLVGRIRALGSGFVVVGVVRIELPDGQSSPDFHLDDPVTVTAVSIGDEMYVAEKVILHDRGAISGESPFL